MATDKKQARKDALIKTKNKKNQAVHLELPGSVLVLRPIIGEYQQAKSRERLQCKWHGLCAQSSAYERWRAQQLFQKGMFDLTFSGLAARAYAALFDLSAADLPYCTPSKVEKISSLAKSLSESLPTSSLLPDDAQQLGFRNGLGSLCRWRPSELQAESSGRGDPARRWMIRKIAEEFCYATAAPPSVAIVGDLIRLGWPAIVDRSIRNTLTPELMTNAMDLAAIRRRQENHATAITHQAIAKVSSQAKIGAADGNIKLDDELSLIAEMERLAASLPDVNMRKRTLSFMQALRDEAGYPQEEPDEGN